MSEDTDRRLLTRIALRNYKSIGACDVRPAQLSFLVGPNGSGKSNFLDGLRFVADALSFSLDHALRDRGGIQEVRRRSGGHPNHFGIRLEFALPESTGSYAFEVGAQKRGGYTIQREECTVIRRGGSPGTDLYRVEDGTVVLSTLSPAPAAASDRLYLVHVSGVAVFRPLYDALAGMGFYKLNPDEIRDLQPPDPGDLLKRDGSNLASVLSNLWNGEGDVAPILPSQRRRGSIDSRNLQKILMRWGSENRKQRPVGGFGHLDKSPRRSGGFKHSFTRRRYDATPEGEPSRLDVASLRRGVRPPPSVSSTRCRDASSRRAMRATPS